EATAVIRPMESGERAFSLDGHAYALPGANTGPAGAHDIGIWLGAYGPRMVRLTGRLADGWIPSLPRMPLADVPARQEAIDEAARRAGRDPAAIRRVANVSPGGGFLDGPLQTQVEQLVGLVRGLRFDAFVFPLGDDPAREIDRLAGEVAPAVRAALGEA